MTVCAVAPVFVHVTVVPFGTEMLAGWNAKSMIATAPPADDPAGAAALGAAALGAELAEEPQAASTRASATMGPTIRRWCWMEVMWAPPSSVGHHGPIWPARRDSNPRPTDPKSVALIH